MGCCVEHSLRIGDLNENVFLTWMRHRTLSLTCPESNLNKDAEVVASVRVEELKGSAYLGNTHGKSLGL